MNYKDDLVKLFLILNTFIFFLVIVKKPYNKQLI